MAMVKYCLNTEMRKYLGTIHPEYWVNKPVCFINIKNQI